MGPVPLHLSPIITLSQIISTFLLTMITLELMQMSRLFCKLHFNTFKILEFLLSKNIRYLTENLHSLKESSVNLKNDSKFSKTFQSNFPRKTLIKEMKIHIDYHKLSS